MRKTKVVIVGAGPSGGACGIALARSGKFDVELLDKSHYPRIKVCGSGLSPLALSVLGGLDMRDRFAERAARIHALDVRGPGGRRLVMDSGSGGAWVVPRVEFDQALAQEAARSGAIFREETKVTGVLRDPDGTIRGVVANGEEMEADLVIFANGSPSRFERDDSPREGIRTLMGWWRGVSLPEGQAVMAWDARLEGYYLWAFPEPDGVVNIGLTIPEEAEHARRLKPLFQELLDEHFGVELEDAELVRKWMGHPATVTKRIGEIAESRGIWIGEAARLVSPGTVEGISFAMLSGTVAARHLARSYDPAHGWRSREIATYRAAVGARMLPMFLAGAGFARAIKNPTVTGIGNRLLHGWVSEVFTDSIRRAFGSGAHQTAA